MRFVIKLLFIISLITIISGCGKKEKTKDEITITVACPGSTVDVGIRTIDEIMKEYEALNPRIKIKRLWESGSGTDYFQKVLTMIAGGTPPDVFRVVPDWMPQFIQKGALLSIDDFLKESKVLSLDDFFPQVLWKYRFDFDGKVIGKGPIYGLGTDWSPDFTLFYNKDLFDKAGLPYPERSLAWDEFAETARRLTIRDETGRAIQLGANPPGSSLFYQNGVVYFSEDGKICLLDSPETIGTLQFLNDLINKYKVSPTQRDVGSVTGGVGGTDILAIFQTGRLAMFFSGRHYVTIVNNVVEDRFRWGVGPSLRNKKRANTIQGPAGWVISKDTKYPEEAYKLFEYLVYENSAKLAEIGYNIPVLKKLAYSDVFLTNPKHKPEGVNMVFLDEVEYSIPTPIIPFVPTPQWEAVFNDELERMYLGLKTPEQAAKDMSDKINALINEKLKDDSVKNNMIDYEK